MNLVAPKIWVDSENLYIQDINDMVEYFSVLVGGAEGWEVSTQYKEDEITTIPIVYLWLMGAESYTLAVKSVCLGEVSESSNEVVWNEDGTYDNGDDSGEEEPSTPKTPYDYGLTGYWVDEELCDECRDYPVAAGYPASLYLANGMRLTLNDASMGQYLYVAVDGETQMFYQFIYWDHPEYYTFLVGQKAETVCTTRCIKYNFYMDGLLKFTNTLYLVTYGALTFTGDIVGLTDSIVLVSCSYDNRCISYDYGTSLESFTIDPVSVSSVKLYPEPNLHSHTINIYAVSSNLQIAHRFKHYPQSGVRILTDT